MAEFQELIKNFDRIRDYMRSFYVYGFKVRNEYSEKSARTYDNERRRMESWLAGYMRSEYTSKGKQICINVDSRAISQNPFYAAWKAKSFTDNDIMLHFFLLDQLFEEPEGLSAGELGDRMAESYGVFFDSQTVRLKLKEYEKLEILISVKKGKTVLYRLLPEENGSLALTGESWKSSLLAAALFFQGAAPFGLVGSTILDRENVQNEWFRFKHHFIVHTLEDGVLLELLKAMKAHRAITFTNKSARSGRTAQMTGIPLKVFVSTRTGRRYVCCYLEQRRRFVNYRLDSISQVKQGELCSDYERKQELLHRNLNYCWGVSFGGPSRLEELVVKLYIDEEKEPYILNRLYREGRGGEVLRVRENEYIYSGTFFDSKEMLSWLKSFTGRILDVQGSNQEAVTRVVYDWERMYKMYVKEG